MAEKYLGTLGIFQHCGGAGSPVGRADSSGLDCTYWKACRRRRVSSTLRPTQQVVDGGVNNHTVGIDQVQATQCLAFVIQDVESVADLFVEVSDQGIVDVTDTTLVAGLNPGQVAVLLSTETPRISQFLLEKSA